MVCLICRNDNDRTMALTSVASRCRQIEARLVFIGSETCCEVAREDVRRASPEALQYLYFRPVAVLDEQDCRRESYSWESAFENIHSIILEYASIGGPVIGWIETLLPRQKDLFRKVFHLQKSLESKAESFLSVLIHAIQLSDLTDSDSRLLLEDQNIVISASVLASGCSSWILGRSGALGASFITDVPQIGQESEINITEMLQLENQKALELTVAGIAHELGNPLSIINSSLQYLHEKLAEQNDPASDFTKTALANIDRMHEVLRGMLEYTGSNKPPRQQIDLNEIVSEVLRFTSTECGRQSIDVEVSSDPELSNVWINPCRVRQVLLNLVSNGLDAMGTCGDRLAVRTRVASDRTEVVVEVENNGPRISEEILPRVFRPFFTTKEGGTGLGLYLSRQIARDHGGTLGVENLTDGVRFTLKLPLRRQEGDGDGECLDC